MIGRVRNYRNFQGYRLQRKRLKIFTAFYGSWTKSVPFFRTRKSFDWQCKTWIRHLNDFLKTEPAGSVTIEEAEEFGKYAEEYGTMCYSQHKIVASNGKKLLSLLQGKKSQNQPKNEAWYHCNTWSHSKPV